MHNAITIDALKVLDAIDRKGSFAGAANALFRVPSAISYTVQKLEDDLKVEIFDRSGHRAVLTPAGRYLLDQGRNLLDATDALARATRALDCQMPNLIHGQLAAAYRQIEPAS